MLPFWLLVAQPCSMARAMLILRFRLRIIFPWTKYWDLGASPSSEASRRGYLLVCLTGQALVRISHISLSCLWHKIWSSKQLLYSNSWGICPVTYRRSEQMISWSFLFFNSETQVFPMAPMKLYPSEPAAAAASWQMLGTAFPSGLASLSYRTAFKLELM